MQQAEALSAAHPVYLGVTSFWKASFYWCSFYWTLRVTLCRFSLQHLAMVSASVSIFIRMSCFSEVALPLSPLLPLAKRLWMRPEQGRKQSASAAQEPQEQIWEVIRLQWIPLHSLFWRCLSIWCYLWEREKINSQDGKLVMVKFPLPQVLRWCCGRRLVGVMWGRSLSCLGFDEGFGEWDVHIWAQALCAHPTSC